MKINRGDNLKTIVILLFIVTLTRFIEGIPWWSFIIPVIILGQIVTLLNWNIASFLVGFFSGFLIWVCSHVYYQIIFEGSILSKNGFLHLYVIILISGLIGGVLTGLAFYIGKNIFSTKTDANVTIAKRSK